ncbi:inorganic phosphate transporter [Winogradskyella alexanderae]|uniref:Phosphate transporter n=1 Tax=Winogradskyella alexanderae TaxID=2877123 RepID=A0ABS7XQD1_9FLAO|nr:inorganic phosphate transporter [Winogradskyella alexanderae]MCA0131051.1 inorganic phosphate transporter [Winogradskyella alexanderae]
MENLYIYMLAALAFLAIADLIVGVSNDAVNFLNSAIGSKAVSFKTIMIVASLGVAVGALTSSGMMEVARKGIFNPGEFMFNEIMIIFMAVMLTDILLLDFFNTLGLPTSTTVSIVFELLGASVAIALIKIYSNDAENITALTSYINNSKAIEIILGILLSVVVAFTIGAVIQYISRLLLSFKFEEKPIVYSAIFSGFAITSIMYFIIVKGLKNATFIPSTVNEFLDTNPYTFIGISFLIFTLLSYIAVELFNAKIYTIIIVIGTFALAVAFAGNDLVNFIGVPIAAYNSYEAWVVSGVAPSNYVMTALGEPVQTEPLLLLIAGLVMVLTLWFSSKAKAVVKTSVDLSRQDEVKERFEPNFLSRNIVRLSIGLNDSVMRLLPQSFKGWSNNQFVQPTTFLKKQDRPAFDLVRAAVNLMVASVLISIATSMKLPLSTTYVTFMVAMGTSLADRAWGSESAVYRVAGVLNVIGGWFFTALSAFVAASLMAYVLFIGGGYALVGLFVLAIFLLAKNYLTHRKKTKEQREEDHLERAESSSTQGVIHESASNIANVVKRGNKIYTSAINGLATQNLATLKKNRKQISKLSDEIDDLKDNIFYFIRNLEEPSVSASNFYLNILGSLQDMTQSLDYISRASHKHINNNHKKLKFSQIKELKDLDEKMETLFVATQNAFESRSFEMIGEVIVQKPIVFNLVKEKIQRQVERTRTEESSPKNTTLYFSLLLETKDLLTAAMNLLEEYYSAHDSSVEPAKASNTEESS